MKRTIKLFAVTITLSLLFNSCGPLYKAIALNKITVEKGAIPADFGKEDTVLLCILFEKKYHDKKVKKIIEKAYKGQFEFVLKSDLDKEKYQDLKKYRYVLDCMWTNSTDPNFLHYYMEDRKDGEIYLSYALFGNYLKAVQAYAINLEKLRSSNQSLNQSI